MTSPLAEVLGLYNANASLEDAWTIPAPWYLDGRIASLVRRFR